MHLKIILFFSGHEGEDIIIEAVEKKYCATY